MKYIDDYDAKFDIWVAESKVHPLPKIANLPEFSSKKFSSYEELNRWKSDYLEQIASTGGVTWIK